MSNDTETYIRGSTLFGSTNDPNSSLITWKYPLLPTYLVAFNKRLKGALQQVLS